MHLKAEPVMVDLAVVAEMVTLMVVEAVAIVVEMLEMMVMVPMVQAHTILVPILVIRQEQEKAMVK